VEQLEKVQRRATKLVTSLRDICHTKSACKPWIYHP